MKGPLRYLSENICPMPWWMQPHWMLAWHDASPEHRRILYLASHIGPILRGLSVMQEPLGELSLRQIYIHFAGMPMYETYTREDILAAIKVLGGKKEDTGLGMTLPAIVTLDGELVLTHIDGRVPTYYKGGLATKRKYAEDAAGASRPLSPGKNADSPVSMPKATDIMAEMDGTTKEWWGRSPARKKWFAELVTAEGSPHSNTDEKILRAAALASERSCEALPKEQRDKFDSMKHIRKTLNEITKEAGGRGERR